MKGVVVTGSGAICGAGRSPGAIVDAMLEGRSALAPIASWDVAHWPRPIAAEIADYNAGSLAGDRKLLKLIRRTDVVGLYAAGEAVRESGYVAHRDSLAEGAAATFAERTGLYAGSGGGNYQNQYDYFPLIAETEGALSAFGRELGSGVNPMWLLKSLPNNVLCHVGIRFGIKGPNACITDHSVSGMLAIVEAAAGIVNDESDRAVAVGHDTPIEPQNVLYYHEAGLLAKHALKPFDVSRDGSLMGEGAGALMVESEASATARGATVLGRVLGAGHATESEGLLAIRPDGAGPARAIRAALGEAGIDASDVGMVVAHGNGTPASDCSEALAILEVFGASPPPVTAFKWSIGHLIAAAGAIETVLALEALHRGVVPGIPVLERIDPAFAALPVSRDARKVRSGIAVVISRGFGGTNAVLVVAAR
ncbi:MAG: beta-ketoacyl synthase N-terminal-like domain-containing protein [Betaproteobacteria bacterium]